MRLLYAGSHECAEPTFKRLMLIADQIEFTDRPSIMFGQWGTIGLQSPFRAWVHAFRGKPVELSVYDPPHTGPVQQLYMRYVEADLKDLGFRSTFLSGLRDDKAFASRFIQLDASYDAKTKGTDVLRALVADHSLRTADLGNPNEYKGRPFIMDDPASRIQTLGTILTDLSVGLTTAMVAAAQNNALPVVDDSRLMQLLAVRLSGGLYGGKEPPALPQVGLEITRAVIPDEALQKLTLADIMNYREKAGDAYRAWTAELNTIADELDRIAPEELQTRVPRLVAKKIQPKIIQYENEMKSVAESLFGDLLKGVVNAAVPWLSLGLASYVSFDSALIGFVISMGTNIPSATTNFVLANRKVKRAHGLAYLIDLKR